IAKGKKEEYAFSDEERDEILAKLASGDKESGNTEEIDDTKLAGVKIQRYKGLGEMNASELWETTMDPERRVLLKVTVEDAEKADAIFNKLMGTEVETRKNFIQTHARYVKDLDI